MSVDFFFRAQPSRFGVVFQGDFFFFCLHLLFVLYTLVVFVCARFDKTAITVRVSLEWNTHFRFYGICTTFICRFRYTIYLCAFIRTIVYILLNYRQYLLVRPRSQFNDFGSKIQDNSDKIIIMIMNIYIQIGIYIYVNKWERLSHKMRCRIF